MTAATTWERPAQAKRPPRMDPVWRRAPGALARVPSVLAATLGAAAVLGLAAASGPLFAASAAEATRIAEVEALDPAEAGLVVEVPVTAGPEDFAALEEALAADVGGALPELGAARHAVRTVPVTLSSSDGEDRVRLVSSEAAPVDGLTVPRAVASDLGLAAGDAVELERSGRSASATVAEVVDEVVAGEFAALVGTPETVIALASHLGAGMDARFSFPLEPADVTDVDGLAARVQAAQRRIADPGSDVGAAVGEHAEFRTRVHTASALPAAARRTAEAAAALEPAVRSLWVAALFAGLVVVAGAAALRTRRHRLEHDVLAARGVTPAAQAARATLETALPVALGVTLGFAAAVGLVAALGPGGHGAAGLVEAVFAGVAAGFVALGLVAATTAALLRGGHLVAARARSAAGRVPWEAAPLALAALAYTALGPRPAGAGVDPLVLAFPVLALIGAVGVAARLLAAVLPRLRRVAGGAPTPVLLLVRRVAAAPAAAVALVAVTGLAVGLLVTAATLAASAAETASAKAGVAVGADAAAPAPSLVPGEPVPDTTVVGRGEVRLEPGGERVDLLAVDTAGFADVAAWRPAFAAQPLPEVLSRITAQPDAAVPVIVVGDLDAEPLRLHGPGFVVPVRAAATAEVFPGLRGAQPLVVADRDVLAAVVEAEGGRPLPAALTAEVWARGSPEEATARAVEAGADADDVRTAAAAADSAALRAARWTLGYLQGVAAAAGLLAALAVALTLTERQRAREIAYALARRMGLARDAHRRSVAGELGALLAAALLLGTGFGLAVAALAVPAVDPLPAQPPAALFAVPWAALAATSAGAVMIVLSGASLVQRAADRTRVAEVLRAPG